MLRPIDNASKVLVSAATYARMESGHQQTVWLFQTLDTYSQAKVAGSWE